MIEKNNFKTIQTQNENFVMTRTVVVVTSITLIMVSSLFGFSELAFAAEDIGEKADLHKADKLRERAEKLQEKSNQLQDKADKLGMEAERLFQVVEKLEDTSGTRITLKDLGVLQLAAHDLFLVDRESEIDHENGKLDLSTLLNYGTENIAFGGEPRNRENIMLFTVASDLGERYLELLDKGKTPEDAQKEIVKKYHKMIKKSYKNAFGESLPEPVDGKATFTENLALRTIHDFLPGNIVVDRAVTPVLDTSLHGKMLKKSELKQPSSKLDGQFDSEFRNIRIVIPPEIDMTIDLLERDSSFAQQFGTDFTFEYFLDEVSDGSFDEDDEVMKQIRNLFAKGLLL